MARFYFDLHECGAVMPDQDGVDADHAEAAHGLAVAAARDIMCGEIRRGTLCLSCHIEIRDERHLLVEKMLFRDAIVITGL